MQTLLDYLNEARPYRTVYAPAMAERPMVVACIPSQVQDAIGWARDRLGREPDRFWLGGRRCPSLPASRIVTPDFILDNPDYAVVVFGPKPRRIALELSLAGVESFHFASDPGFKAVKSSPFYFQKNREKLFEDFALLADDESRRTYASIIKHRLSADHGHLRMARYPQYRHPRVKPEPGDWVIDLGAADGATSVSFARQVGRSGRVIACEPDLANVALIMGKRLVGGLGSAAEDSAEIKVIRAAVSAVSGEIGFSSGRGWSSQVDPSSTAKVPVKTLDDIAAECGLGGPGLISFDIEGEELNALKGGLSMLKALRPKLQISIYHKSNDLFAIPLWVSRNLPDYKFYVGHHDCYHSETDLYCEPLG